MADEPNNVSHIAQPRADTPLIVISELMRLKDDIDEIFVVIKRKDGTFEPCNSGSMTGLAFAILLQQDIWVHSP